MPENEKYGTDAPHNLTNLKGAIEESVHHHVPNLNKKFNETRPDAYEAATATSVAQEELLKLRHFLNETFPDSVGYQPVGWVIEKLTKQKEVLEGEGLEIASAVAVLVKNLFYDPGYYEVWQSNLAMTMYDEFRAQGSEMRSDHLHMLCNAAARRFLDHLMLHTAEKTGEDLLKRISPTDALYGFVSWLTTRDTRLVLGRQYDAAPAAEALSEYVTRLNLPGVSKYYPGNVAPLPEACSNINFAGLATPPTCGTESAIGLEPLRGE